MTSRPRTRRLVLAAAAALFVLAALVPGLAACASMDKDRIERELLALAKNAPVAELGLERRTIEVTLEGEPHEVEAVFYRAPRPEARPEGPRPTVVLVHGTPSSLFTWTEVVFGGEGYRGLAESCDVVALDVIGHGVTPTKVPPYSFQRCADYVAGAIEALDLTDVCLVGQSYGGEFVWRAALDHPERITRVVLMDSAGYPRRDDEWLPEEVKMREWWIARWGYVANSRERILSALQPHFADPVSDDRRDEIYFVCANADSWRAMVELARDENGTRSGELTGLRQPTLLLWGARDVAYKPDRFAVLFDRDIPDSHLVLVEDSGHYPQEEQPAAVVAALEEFLGIAR
jgi:pimeloyl-ACP methyl ester carboxylesterase